jgi:4-amino-4-deoxy-L-arabinose transferase-like glycosyltransferase
MGSLQTWKKYIWHGLPVMAFLLWGALCITGQLWYDEAFSAGMVMQPFLRLVYLTAVDNHSPFYYCMLKIFYQLCGGSGFSILKIFSLLFMLGYMLLGKYYVRKLFDMEISIWFMLFSLLMPIMCVQAGNVRVYAMALFFMTLTGLLAYDIYREDSRKKRVKKWCLFCISSTCIVYCHTFAMIQTVWLYLLFAAALLCSRQYQKIKGLFASGIVTAVLFSPWLLVTAKQMELRMSNDTGSTSELAGPASLIDYCREWFSALETPIDGVVAAGGIVAVVLCGAAFYAMRKTKNYAPALGLAAFFLTAVTGFIISVSVNNCFLGRYAFPGFGSLMLMYAVGMQAIKPPGVKGCVLVVMLCCFLLQYRSELALEYDGGLETYEDFWNQYVGEGDVFVGPYRHTIFLSIYHPETTYYLSGYVPACLPFPNLEPCYDMRELVQENSNVWYIAFEGESPDDVEEGIDYEETFSFHYMYYDFVIYKIIG